MRSTVFLAVRVTPLVILKGTDSDIEKTNQSLD